MADVTIAHALPALGKARRLSGSFAFSLQVSILVFFLAGSSAPTPLYAIYEARWGFSPITVTVVFGVYALAVLGALLTVGSLSDFVGRRPVLLVATALQAATMLIFATANGESALLVARIVQGLATGAAMGALGAGLLALHKTKGTIATGVGPLFGTGSGALGSSLLVQFLPEPTHLVYIVLFTVFVLQGIGVALMSDLSVMKAGVLASLKPQLGVPAAVRRSLARAVPALVAVWSLAGFYGSLGPTLVRLIVGSSAVVFGGLALFALAVSAAGMVFLSRAAVPRTVLLMGTAALMLGVGLTLLALVVASPAVFFAGTVVAGVGFGGGFQGALRTVLPLTAPHERAGVLSAIYVVCYLAMGLPAVIAGFLVVQGGVLTTAWEYGVAVIVLAALALVGVAWRREEHAGRAEASLPAEAERHVGARCPAAS